MTHQGPLTTADGITFHDEGPSERGLEFQRAYRELTLQHRCCFQAALDENGNAVLIMYVHVGPGPMYIGEQVQ